MDPEFSALLSQFTETAGRLNSASDSLNSILSTIEKRLVEANVGVETWLSSDLVQSDSEGSSGGETTWTSQVLGFAKIEGEWGLAVKPVKHVSGFFQGDDNCPYGMRYKDGEPVRLLKASREIRIKALEAAPQLIKQLTEEADRYIQTIEQAKSLAA